MARTKIANRVRSARTTIWFKPAVLSRVNRYAKSNEISRDKLVEYALIERMDKGAPQ